MSAPTGGYGRPSVDGAEASAGWQVLGAVGLTLWIVGLVDLLLAWVPPHFGSPEWEFGTISATLNNLPVPAMGLALVLAFAAADRRRGQLVTVGLWSGLVVLFLLVSAVFYALDVPLALRAVQEPVPRAGLRSGMVKAVAAFLTYLGFHLWATVFAFRRSRSAA
jgi:hypothetical protein